MVGEYTGCSGEGVDGADGGVDVGLAGDDAGAEPQVGIGVGGDAGQDPLAAEGGGLVGAPVADIQADDPSRQLGRTGVTRRTLGIAARPSLRRGGSARVRAATVALPSPRWNRNASASAQRCSQAWKPPGSKKAPPGKFGVRPP